MKKPNSMAVLLFLTGLLCIVSLLFISRSVYQHTVTAEKDLDGVIERVLMKQDEIKEAETIYMEAVAKKQANIKRLKQKALTSGETSERERADIESDDVSRPSVFSEGNDSDVFSDEFISEPGDES